MFIAPNHDVYCFKFTLVFIFLVWTFFYIENSELIHITYWGKRFSEIYFLQKKNIFQLL